MTISQFRLAQGTKKPRKVMKELKSKTAYERYEMLFLRALKS